MRNTTTIPTLLATLLLFAVVCPSAAAQTAAEEIRLSVGESTLIRVEEAITRVVVGNPRVADVRATGPREVLVVGRGRGATTITATTSSGERYNYSVNVSAVETGSLLELVRGFLGPMEGVYPRIYGDMVVVEGEATTAEVFGRAQRATELFGSQVKNFGRFRPSAIEQVNKVLRKVGLADVQANLISGKMFLEGSVGSEEDMNKARAVARAYGLDAENLITMGRSLMVEVDVEFVEVRRTGLDRIGIRWPSSVGATGEATLTHTPWFEGSGQAPPSQLGLNVLSDTSMTLEMLFSDGYARLLAQPRLVCASGSKAQFLAGGEVPVVVINDRTVNVEYKDFGVKLDVAPVADARGNINMELLAEVSQVDESLRTLGVPGFRTRRVKTSVTVREGQSIVLSGLFTNEESKAVQRFPLLGNIPIIGELFKSREFRQDRSNLVVFVTPHVVTPQAPRVQRAIRNIQKMYREARGQVRWGILD
jgi:pilus assembly protein CpaC